MKNQKLKTKDLFTITPLTLVNVIIFLAGSFFYISPITILAMPVVFSLLDGIVFYVICQKRRIPYLFHQRYYGFLSSVHPLVRARRTDCGTDNGKIQIWEFERRVCQLYCNAGSWSHRRNHIPLCNCI